MSAPSSPGGPGRPGPDVSPFLLLTERARQTPDDVPFRALSGRELTYRSWAGHAAGLRELLSADAGVRHGDRILLIFDRESWLEYAVAYLAVIGTGATAVSVHADDGHEVAAAAQRSMRTVITVTAGRRPVQLARSLGQHIEVDLAVGPAARRAAPGDVSELAADALADILLTSGTTGPRKAVGCTYADVTAALRQSVSAPSDRFPDQSALVHHIMPGTQAGQRVLLQALSNNRLTSVHVESFRPQALLDAVQAAQAKFVGLVPWTAGHLVEACLREHRELRTVAWVSIGSAHVPPRLLHGLARVFPAAQVMNMYGLTEAGWARIHGTYPDRIGSIGTPEPGTKAEVRAEDGLPAPAGCLGELWVSHRDSPSRCYVGDPARTARTFRDGWVRTGDLARRDEDGYVYVAGRETEMINHAGRLISPLEIEDHLLAHDLVQDAAVYGVPDPGGGERIVAAVVGKDSAASPSSGSLLDYCRAGLDPEQVPGELILAESLPVGPFGTVQKKRLRQLHAG